jgi:MMP 1-O-methyltransferase
MPQSAQHFRSKSLFLGVQGMKDSCSGLDWSIEETRRLTETINGKLLPQEAEFLWSLARNCTGRGVIVEIGSWQGKSTAWLAAGSKGGAKATVYAIDPHIVKPENAQIFKENMMRAGLDDLVQPLVMTSAKAAENFEKPVELLFVDGDHKYEAVKLDFELWYPKLLDGGTIAFHDRNSSGPRRLIDESVRASSHFRELGTKVEILYAKKVLKPSRAGGFNNRVFWLRYDGEDIAKKYHVPRFIQRLGAWLLKQL